MSEPFLGEIRLFGFNFPPRGWALCEGQLLPISSNQALFALLGTIYGGDGRTTFALPDLRGRAPVHSGNSAGPGLTLRTLGSKGGTEDSTLNTNNLSSHNHTATTSVETYNGRGSEETPGGHILSRAQDGESNFAGTGTVDGALSAAAAATQLAPSGAPAPQAFNNVPPFLTVNYCIALTGLFPSRN